MSYIEEIQREFYQVAHENEILQKGAAFGAHIFFDDQDIHTEPASAVAPAATVPYRDGDNPKEQTALYYSKMVGIKQCRLIHMYQKGNLN